jgi:hypothetical protein
MTKGELKQLSGTLRSLGVSGVIGSALGRFTFHAFPAVQSHGISDYHSALLGAAVLAAAVPFFAYYLRMFELVAEVKVGWMSAERAARIRQVLQQLHYVGRRARSSDGRGRRRIPIAGE